MSGSKTVVLELLRDGPSYNQLLSPLTVYLAACQNRPPEALRLTIEHRDFLRWQGGLTYASGRRIPLPSDERRSNVQVQAKSEGERRNAIEDATLAVTSVLGSIRALIAELASEPHEWRHIHLVLDAAELAALPFELARAAPGLMVEGERLLLQQNARVTLTRQTRRVATSVVTWPSRPRILCIVADGKLPLDAHVLALRQSIDPWIGWNDGDDVHTNKSQLLKNRSGEAEQMLTVLENPTLDDVSSETRRTRYTHVHVLAHGAPLPSVGAGQTLYGLCFRGRTGEVDVVDGDRLEAALRNGRDYTNPTVVTLATCEGANVTGGILGPGGSAAHALHAKGVPLVIAAQFPLSKGASVIFAEMLYGGLLRGEDPRQLVHSIRRELVVAYPETHDWASLVVYGSFPADLDGQLRGVRLTAEKLAVETAVERLRVTLRTFGLWDDALGAKKRERLESDVNRLDRAAAAIQAWTQASNDLATRVAGYRLLARIALRLWDVYKIRTDEQPDQSTSERLQRKEEHDVVTGRRPVSMLRPRELLELAKRSYEIAYFLDSSRAAVWVQVVALSLALSNGETLAGFKNDLRALRYMAALLVERGVAEGVGGRDDRSLAAAMVFEVELLALLAGLGQLYEDHEGERKPLELAFDAFVRAASPVSTSYRAHAVWRQLRRYEVWRPGRPEVVAYRKKLEEFGVRRYWNPRS